MTHSARVGRLGGRPPQLSRDALVALLVASARPRAWRLGELAAICGIERNKIRRSLSDGTLPAVRIPCGSRFEHVVAHVDALVFCMPFLDVN